MSSTIRIWWVTITASGVMLPAWPLVVENVVCVVLAGFILAMKLLPHHLRHAVADRIDPDVPSP